MKYSRILGVAAALLVTSAVASQAATPAAKPPTAISNPQPASNEPAGSLGEGAKPQAPVIQNATAQPAAEPAAAPAAPAADAKPAVAGDPKVGQTKAAACAACHGGDGNSTDAQYPRLAGQHERTILKQLKLFKSGDRESPIMGPMASGLSEQDMRDIGAYFATQHPGTGLADDSKVTSGPYAGKKYWQIGEKLFRAGNAKAGVPACSACHGPLGRGNPGPAYPSLTGQHASYTSGRLNYFRAGSDKAKGSSPAMVDIAKRLTDEEIQGLATYVEGLHPAAVATKAE